MDPNPLSLRPLEFLILGACKLVSLEASKHEQFAAPSVRDGKQLSAELIGYL